MKKLLSFAVVCALCGFAVACGGDTTPEEDIHIYTDVQDDANVPDTVINQDADRDENTPPEDTNVPVDTNVPPEDTNVPPTDEGVDTNVPPEDVTECNEGVGSCKYYFECRNNCPQQGTEEGDACIAVCDGELTLEGQEDKTVILECIQICQNNSTTQAALDACINENCTEAIIGCFWGCTYQTCAEMYGCFDGCPEDNTATTENEAQLCFSECRDGSSEQAQLDLNAMYDCAFAECPICETDDTAEEETECNNCFNDALYGTCWEQYKACAESGTKYMTCVDFTICFTTCQYTAQTQAAYDACVDECKSGVDADALRDRIMAEQCSIDNCPACSIEEPTAAEDEQCNTCWANSQTGDCADEWAVCLPHGEDSCNDVFTCIQACGDNACASACYGEGTFAAQDLYAAFETCLSETCASATTAAEFQTCANTAINAGGDCNDEYTACTGA